jgi:hypothetical protein
MLIVLLDEAVGAVRTGAGLVVGREWLRYAEPVAAVEGRGARYWRAGLLLIVVVMSSGVSSSSRGWGLGLVVTHSGKALARGLGSWLLARST